MKKNILTGIVSPLFYFMTFNFFIWILQGNGQGEIFSALCNILILLLPALPGVAVTRVFVSDSLGKYFQSVCTCFLISFAVFFAYLASGIESHMYRWITGYEEVSLGEGLLFAVTINSYLISCLLGCVIAGCVTVHKRNKAKKNRCVNSEESKVKTVGKDGKL